MAGMSQIDAIPPLPLFHTILPERHPCVGALAMLEKRVLVTTVTHCQIGTQDGGQLDIEHALVLMSSELRIHLVVQDEEIRLPIAANS